MCADKRPLTLGTAGSNFLTNTMLTGAYNKPFAVTYLNTSSFALVSTASAARSWRR
jgi:hypothetical protein